MQGVKPKMSLKQALEQASQAVKDSPDWLKAIYKQNNDIEKELKRQGRKV